MTRVHRNLHKSRAGGPQWVVTKNGRVQQYHDTMVLSDVTTRIRPASAAKCLESGKRDVCAYFDGTVVDEEVLQTGSFQRISYDPRQDEDFLVDGEPWTQAEVVLLEADGTAWALNAR